ncbi:hypothetical protein IG605_010040 [Pectobacterium quasiaquaticum]|uniref:hypothetical protein n=1 Tax=Pectobacterium quasiaquaticum TaxID=2774015 RepID=UPI001875A41D|nr:hypothetical protein [Pectobacterium quasiaquaticum]URG54575.1 hypothetical protein IG605_010040 [Pectobacterium quasiaquaticum]
MKKIIFWAVGTVLLCEVARAFLVPVIMAGETIGAAVLRSIISRGAAQAAVSAAERQVLANATKTALNQSVARLATGYSTPTRLQLASGAATWAFLGSEMLKIGDAIFAEQIFGADESGTAGISSSPDIKTVDNGRRFYIGAGKGGAAPILSGDYPERLISAAYKYRAENGFLYCPSGAQCTYGSGLRMNRVTPSGDGRFTQYEAGYDITYGGKTVSLGEIFSVHKNFGYDPAVTPVSPDITPEQQLFAQKTALDAQQMADTLNALMMDAAAQPDYRGIAVTSANPLISAQDVLTAASTVGRPNPTQAEWTTPWSDLQPETLPQPNPEPNPQPQPEPPAVPPELDTPPDGKTVLAPIVGAFSEWENFSIGARAAQCPIAEFSVWHKNFIVDSHCGLIEKNRELIKLFCLICWGFAAFRRVMSA